MAKNNDKPLYNKGGIIISGITVNGTPSYEVFDGRKDTRNPIRIVTKARQQGIDLEPADIAALLKGEELEAPIDRGEKKPLMRLIFSTGVATVPRTVGEKTYTNHYLNVRSCLVNRDKEDNNISYSFVHPEDRKIEDPKARRNVSVYANVGKRENPVPVSAAHAHAILEGETVTVEGRAHLSLKGIEKNDNGFLEARIDIDWIQQKERTMVFAGVEDSGDDEGDDVPFREGSSGSPKTRQTAGARP